ncbi:gluconate 2-dehydrogenase gamma chain [Paenibacillus cellulosilyticus]|uniref:Gluconate 2-dehydrogenase gamma chain n=1 Tax=Paenibacillus cellulosilyticus TaxID=375489 RepID=A0A2V2YUE6_9BACL|nr:gluconate 2-dehydrogenase subunit 3 family protein [Paenibacillus cellulosilyticus]PWW02887.1 gluconate 2-dehydrogenase gamma chain [Paenibacillus cellulosilyticus]QKS45800.1 gluconate 2-dehydrogenase subunit 3 family protein [Paenibacillus cellulosilyticus]
MVQSDQDSLSEKTPSTEATKTPQSENEAHNSSRRKFLKTTGYALGGLAVGGVLSSLIGCSKKETTDESTTETPATNTGTTEEIRNYNRALMFFTQEQYLIVESAAERIFPEDDNGPGAKALGVAFFIDHQLAGDYGFNGRDYMNAPFYSGEKEQGYQGRLKRREIYEIGIRELDNYSNTKYQKGFTSLAAEEMDAVLKDFESDTAALTTISASAFFKMLRTNTLEGAYSDPLYGGNANMNGWRMRGYPGNQMSYAAAIDQGYTTMEPSSLQDHMAAH